MLVLAVLALYPKKYFRIAILTNVKTADLKEEKQIQLKVKVFFIYSILKSFLELQ
jgi:hypothetical protein